MNEVIKMPKKDVNVLGLRKGQAELFGYICKCSNEKKTVQMHQVAVIYYTHVRIWSREYVEDKWVKEKALKIFIREFAANQNTGFHDIYYYPKRWLIHCLGSFIMRGLLVAIPKFNPDEVKEIKT